MVNIKRWFRHAFIPPWRWRVLFSIAKRDCVRYKLYSDNQYLTACFVSKPNGCRYKAVLADIEAAIKHSEHQHSGELRFVVENALALGQVWRGCSARQRALEVFSNLRVWDTEQNSGVLIYLLLADREVHIVADRGITRHVAQAEWDAIAKTMQKAFQGGDFLLGSLQGIECITMLLAAHFPPNADNLNELSNKPVIVKH